MLAFINELVTVLVISRIMLKINTVACQRTSTEACIRPSNLVDSVFDQQAEHGETSGPQSGRRLADLERRIQVIEEKLNDLISYRGVDNLATVAALSQECPTGFISLNETSGCYKLVLEGLNWTDARARCHRLDPRAHLAVIKSAQQDRAIVNYILTLCQTVGSATCPRNFGPNADNGVIYTSGQLDAELDCNSAFVWKPNSTASIPIGYSNWGLRQPDCAHGKEGCLSYNALFNYRWNDGPCTNTAYSICQIEI